MKIMLLAATVGTFLTGGSTFIPSSADRDWATAPPPAWAEADPADSLYRAARRALNQKDYETAAGLFDAILTRFPRSEYAPDALYWKGFALYRNGDLDEAVEALETQARRFPKAGTRSDAEALLIRLKGELAKRGDSDAQREVDSAAAGSGKSCDDMEVQSAALDALQQMDPDRVLPLLKKVLARRDPCSTSLRKNALFILAQKAGSEREKLLLEVARNDPNSGVRQDAVFHLSQAKSDLAVDALEDLLLHSEERGVRSNALFALAQNRSERARNILRVFALSDDAPTGLRNDAIFHLAQRRDSADAAWLRSAYSKLNDGELRKNLMFHIAQRQGQDTDRWLMSIAVDAKESMEQRKNAVFYLANHKSDGTDELVAIYDKVPLELRKDVLFHIAQRHDDGSLEKLIQIAKNDPNKEMRKDALFYIAQSKDPRALKALEEMVSP